MVNSKYARFDRYLSECDRKVRTQARGVGLIDEAGIDSKRSFLALRGIAFVRTKLQTPQQRYEFTRRHRMSLVAGIVAVARDGYAGGALWPAVNAVLEERGHAGGLDADAEAHFREIFVAALRELDVPVVGTGNNLVENAGLHAGIPTYCLQDWFNLTRRARLRVGRDPQDMLAWAVESLGRPVLADMDRPVRQILTVRPEFAADLLDRAAELTEFIETELSADRRRLLAGLDTSQVAIDALGEHDEAFDRAAQLRLAPRWLIEGARNAASTTPGARPAHVPARIDKPFVRLDLIAGEVQVVLPSVPDVQEPIRWTVSYSDRSYRHLADLDLEGSVIRSQTVSVPVTAPTRTVSLIAAGRDTVIPLWGEGFPAAFFTAAGNHRPLVVGSLRAGRYRALVPEGTEALVDGERVALAIDDAPLGWSGWSLVDLELKPGQELTLAYDRERQAVRVAAGAQPELLRPEPVVGAWAFGRPVLAARPRIQLPAAPGTWVVSVSRHGAQEPVWTATFDQAGTYPLLEGLFAQAGTFTVTVRGPLGRGLVETFSLVDGFSATSTPTFRALDPQGRLQPCTVSATAAVGIALDQARVVLSSEQSGTILRMRTDAGAAYSLSLRTPATLVGRQSESGGVRWGPRPVRVDSATVDDRPMLYVRVPRGGSPVVKALAGNSVVQSLAPKRHLGALAYRLGELAGALEVHGSLSLYLGDGQPVGHIGPRGSFLTVQSLDSGRRLELQGWKGDARASEAWVWLAGAPWRPPVRLAITPDGIIDLPVALVESGNLLLHVRQADPWVPEPRPILPVPVTSVVAPGMPRLTGTELALQSWVDTEAGTSLPGEAARQLVAMLRVPAALLPTPAADFWRGMARAARTMPEEVLEALAVEALGVEELARVLVRGSLVTAHAHLDGERAAAVWAASPIVAAVMGGDHLAGDGDHVEGNRARAASALGAFVDHVLDDGQDPSGGAGRFGPEAPMLEAMPPRQLDDLVAHMQLVPRALLDEDSRVARSLALLRRRGEPAVAGFPDVSPWVADAISVLGGAGWEAADIRALAPLGGAKHRWLPAFARAGAHLARRAARGDGSAEALLAARLPWFSRLAFIAPELVLAELARAELLHATHLMATPSGTPEDLALPHRAVA